MYKNREFLIGSFQGRCACEGELYERGRIRRNGSNDLLTREITRCMMRDKLGLESIMERFLEWDLDGMDSELQSYILSYLKTGKLYPDEEATE